MSKKLIAVAAAAALALSALVAIPAAAADFQVAVKGTADSASAGLVKTTPAQNAAPVNNKLVNENRASTTNTAVRFTVTAAAADVAIAVSATAGVKLLTTLFEADGTTALKPGVGAESLSGLSNSSSVFTFYAYSTSTATGTVVMSSGGNTKTYYLRSLVGEAYNVASVEWPTSVAINGYAPVYVKVTDVFGNAIVGGTGNNDDDLVVDAAATATAAAFDKSAIIASSDLNLTVVGGTAGFFSSATTSTDADGAWVWVAAKAAWAAQIKGGANPGSLAARLDLADNDRDNDLVAPVLTSFTSFTAANSTVVIAGLNAQVATLNAQVAALSATIANMRTKALSVTLKRWNNLVKRHRALGGSAKLKTR